MNFLNNSIKKFESGVGPFYELSRTIDYLYPVSLVVVPFSYDISKSTGEETFDIVDFQYLCRGFFSSDIDVAGDLEMWSFERSKTEIDLYIFCGGLGDRPTSKLDLPEERRPAAEKKVLFFWEEVGKVFTLPPTQVYYHSPDDGTCFDGGIFWQFCFIYLNDKTGQGILLSGACFD